MFAGMEQTLQASTAELQATTERNRKDAERRHLALRKQRASTNDGKWLAKNCSDWRRSYNQLKAATAEREMKRHCEIYERYLETGIAKSSVR
jgi:t-SNARE complex subunit (syntaxin)